MAERWEALDSLFLTDDGSLKSADEMEADEGGVFLTLVGTPLEYAAWVYGDVTEPFGRLIVEAPELLDAAEGLLERLGDDYEEYLRPFKQRLRDAVARVRGKE